MSAAIVDRKVVAHIGIVVPDVSAAAEAYAELLGIEVPEVRESAPNSTRRFRGEPQPAHVSIKVARFQIENIEFELLEPIGGPSTWQEALDTRGAGVHHIAFAVSEAASVIEDFERKGYPAIFTSTRANGQPLAYVDGGDRLGVLVEILGE